jgi:general secretion pathway protein D
MPVIGRFFSIPKNTNDTTDLIITVTPHIVRAADISDHDRLAKLAGTQVSGGPGTTIELFLEERDARRVTPAPPATTTTTTTTARVLPSPIPESSARTDAFSQLISAMQPATPVGPAGATLVSAAAPLRSLSDHRIQVLLNADIAQPRAGGSMQLDIMAQGESSLSESLLALDFDPKVLRVREVSDGGGLETPGPPAQISAWRDPEGRLLIHVKPGKGAAAGARTGRLAVVHFDVVSPGSAAIRFDEASSRLQLADGRTALCASKPLIIEAR